MIEDGPKADINPALACGWNAVYVPRAHAWTLEREQIRLGPGKLIVAGRFAELRNYF